MIKVLNAEPREYSRDAADIISQIATYEGRELTRDELIATIPNYHALIVRLGFQVDDEVLDSGIHLKAVASATTGLDHIDLEYAKSRGVEVLSLKGEVEFLRSIPATAEHTWALLQGLTRRIPWAFSSVVKGEWDRDRFRGHDVAGKNLGLLGLGRVGLKVASYGKAFGMKVGAFDPYLTEWPEGVARIQSVRELMSFSDVLSIHVPLDEETTDLIGWDELTSMPKGSYLVNTSRGRVVDERALIRALDRGVIAGAALDVLYEERVSAGSVTSDTLEYAKAHDNLLITPHVGGATIESMASTEIFIANKLSRFLRSRINSLEGAGI